MNIFKQSWFWIIIFAVFISFIVLSYGEQIALFINDVDINDVEGDIAIRVNDETISTEKFNVLVGQWRDYMPDMEEEEVREMVKDEVVGMLLTRSYIKSKDIEVTQDEIDDFYKVIIGDEGDIRDREDIVRLYEEQGMTESDLEEDVLMSIIQEKIYELAVKEGDIDMTEEEIRAEYEEYYELMLEYGVEEEEIGTYEEIKEEIMRQEFYQQFEEEVEEFRKESDIQILI